MDVCEQLHALMQGLPRLRFPFDVQRIPADGIYVLFEQGETAHGGERIVRVGTHTGTSQLPSRLLQHFVRENKDRSIFRKNIGRALLQKEHDAYVDVWELDLTTRKAKETFGSRVDAPKQQAIEQRVTSHLQKHCSFVVVPMRDKEARLAFESKMIATLSHCSSCNASNTWLGLFSPKQKIRESGLWLVNELYKEPLHKNDLQRLQSVLNAANCVEKKTIYSNAAGTCLMIEHIMRKNEKYVYFVFRVLVGFLFFVHGTQKLFGWFGAKGTVPLASMFGAAGVIETIGGAAIMLGLFVRLVSVITTAEMVAAYVIAHVPQGWNPLLNKGEAAVLFFAAFLMLLVHGAGKWSLERALWKKERF